MPKFQVLAGKHIDGKGADGRARVYNAGEVVESRANLLRFNRPGSIKFQRVDDGATIASPAGSPGEIWDRAHESLDQFIKRMQAKDQASIKPINLDTLSFKDLQALAAEEEIDLKGAKTREEALRFIKAVK